jgi:hypothetical protein
MGKIEVYALRDVNLEIYEAEFVVLLGLMVEELSGGILSKFNVIDDCGPPART